MTNINLKIWDAVSSTDPNNTTQVKYGRGFTAICAQSQIKAATALFGPYGIGWGIKDESDEYIRNEAGQVIEYVYKATLWFRWEGEVGTCPCRSSIKYRAGDDCQMKAETHARSKALSKLGFNSDVYEGHFDDDKFVQQARVAQRQQEPRLKDNAMNRLKAVCVKAKVTDEQKKQLVAEWVKKYGVSDFNLLTAAQITNCINEIESGGQR